LWGGRGGERKMDGSTFTVEFQIQAPIFQVESEIKKLVFLESLETFLKAGSFRPW
jgi:hypothetical protein